MLALNAIAQRKQIGLCYYETGSPFEYELVRLLYTKELAVSNDPACRRVG